MICFPLRSGNHDLYCNQPAGGTRHILPTCLFVCASLFYSHFYLPVHLITSMLNLVWPLSRLGGDLWGRLLPPSLPSPLPCPGRGMKDLEGLSTALPLGWEAAPPRDGEDHPPLWPPQSSLHSPLCISFFLVVWPACLHAPQCLCFSSAVWTTPAFYPTRAFNRAARSPAIRTVRALQISNKMAHHNESEWTESTICVRISSHQLIAPALAHSRKPQLPFCVFLFPFVCFNANSLVLTVFGSRSAWFWFMSSQSAWVWRCSPFSSFWWLFTDISAGL